MKKVLSLLLTTAILLSCVAMTAVSANAATRLDSGYYVVGTMNNWTLDRAYRMQSEVDVVGDYILRRVKLNAGDELKVAYSADGIQKTAWYPDSGPSTNYIVPEDSYYNIEFSIDTGYSLGTGEWQLNVEPCDPPTDDPVAPTEPEYIDHVKELWESGALPTAEDIAEAANEQHHSRTAFGADKIKLQNAYRFNCTPAYVVDYDVEGYYYYTVILEQKLGDYLLWSSSSYEPSVFADNRLTTFTKAYAEGILTDEMLAELAEAEYKGSSYGGKCGIVTRYIKGDADGSGEVDIIDATVIQRADARIIGDGDFYKPLGDVDGDGTANVIDVTLIQRYNVGLYEI